MKMLHIELNEHDSIEELIQSFWDMPDEMKKTGAQLTQSRRQAEDKLIYQKQFFPDNMARVFWYEKAEYNGFITYLMYECIED